MPTLAPTDLTLGDLLELAGLPANCFNFKFVDDLDLGFLDGYTSVNFFSWAEVRSLDLVPVIQVVFEFS